MNDIIAVIILTEMEIKHRNGHKNNIYDRNYWSLKELNKGSLDKSVIKTNYPSQTPKENMKLN